MRFPRSSGILLHLTSLPGPFGIGDLGSAAYAFTDFLSACGQSIWQVLPLGPTGYGDSPYQCFSAFAGNPLLVSLEGLRDQGWLSDQDLAPAPDWPAGRVDYAAVYRHREPLFKKAYLTFVQRANEQQRRAFEAFRSEQRQWLGDFSLFMALKQVRNLVEWTRWEPEIRRREPAALEAWRQRLASDMEIIEFTQFQFFSQYRAWKEYCVQNGIRIMGDVPIFVAHDSVDVWANPDLFDLRSDGRPRVVAGVPPDYFSATGQLWGNPLYRWKALAKRGYSWWIDRFRATLDLMDLVRVDHFRGFQAYWEVEGDAQTAVHGRWVEGPGADFFRAVEGELGRLPIIAENLGFITPEVEELREAFEFPGMAILQFAFGGDPLESAFLPHHYVPNLVVYTGTHDNDTTVGWWSATGEGDSTRLPEQVEREKQLARRYLDLDGQEIHWAFNRALLASVADSAIIPLQDILGLGSESRLNLPGRAGGNWQWRFAADALTEEVQKLLLELTWVYGRTSRRPEWL